MEISAWLYFSFWAIIGATFFHLGFDVLEKTESISPLIMSFFKHSLAISTCHSSTYAFLFLPNFKIEPDSRRYYMWMALAVLSLVFHIGTSGGLFKWYNHVYSFINVFALVFYFLLGLKEVFGPYYFNVVIGAFLPFIFYIAIAGTPLWFLFIYMYIIVLDPRVTPVTDAKLGIIVHFAVQLSFFFVSGKTKFFPILVLFVSFFTSVYWAAAVSGGDRFQRWLPLQSIHTNFIFLIVKRMINIKGQVIEFAVAMLATILFQNFFRLTSFDHVLAFLYLAVAWLAILALLVSFSDLGIFNFLLTNVIVGCTVSQFGLRGTTWLAYAASILLYMLRLKLESLSLVNRGEEVEEESYYRVIW